MSLAKYDLLLTARRDLIDSCIGNSSCHKLLLNDKESYKTSNRFGKRKRETTIKKGDGSSWSTGHFFIPEEQSSSEMIDKEAINIVVH